MSVEVALIVVAAGVLVGVLSALFGVGGGLLMVPFMVLLLGESQHVAEGTSLLVIVPTALAGAFAHRRHGYLAPRHAALLAAGGIVGSYVGATLALGMDQARLRLLFGVFLAAMGVRSVYQGRRERAGRGDRRGGGGGRGRGGRARPCGPCGSGPPLTDGNC